MPSERIAQGWRKPVHSRVKVVDVSIPASFAALASHRNSDSLHVFTGFFSHPIVWAGFHKLKSSQAQLAIYSEAPEQPWHTGWLKRLRGRCLAARYAKRFAFVLAIGGIGCEFFEQIGFPKEKIVTFGYYLSVPPLATEPVRQNDGIVRFISAGQLIHRKGIDLLIKACQRLPKAGWHLDIYGDGPERRSLEQLAARLGLTEAISFHGTAENAAVQRAIAASDCAVLPSRFDGWGTLVNEALAAGTPVICTSRCGAAVLLSQCGLSAVAPTASPANLAEAMHFAVQAGPPPPRVRACLAAAIAQRASPPAAAGHMLALLPSA